MWDCAKTHAYVELTLDTNCVLSDVITVAGNWYGLRINGPTVDDAANVTATITAANNKRHFIVPEDKKLILRYVKLSGESSF